jgi:hypothetical protein
MILQKLFELGDLVGAGPGGGRGHAKADGECDDRRRRDSKIHDALLIRASFCLARFVRGLIGPTKGGQGRPPDHAGGRFT